MDRTVGSLSWGSGAPCHVCLVPVQSKTRSRLYTMSAATLTWLRPIQDPVGGATGDYGYDDYVCDDDDDDDDDDEGDDDDDDDDDDDHNDGRGS